MKIPAAAHRLPRRRVVDEHAAFEGQQASHDFAPDASA